MIRRGFALSMLPVLILGIQAVTVAQDKAIYKTKKVGEKEKTYLSVDTAKLKKPQSLDEFQTVWHNPPVRQDTTGTCWAFATTSFLESEVKRLSGREVKLSEMFVVYWEYVEKARRFVREKGNSAFAQGSEPNSAIARVKQYGIVPLSAYTGLIDGRTTHNHTPLAREVRNYLSYIKENGYWDEEKAVEYVKLILNKYLGEPPTTVEVADQVMTPREYAKNYLQLPLDDYVALMSTTKLPFWSKGEYKVPDNWWHSKDYYNVPLKSFYKAIREAIKNGYSLVFGGDVSEPGKVAEADVAFIPSFDIRAKSISQDAREFRFYNHTTGDDHAIHLVGYTKKYGHEWFLVKDSGRSAQKGNFPGYYMFRDDYVKLKMLTILVHRNALADLLKRFETETR